MGRNCSNKDEEQKIISGFLSGDPKAARMFFEKYGGIIRHAVGKADIKGNMMDREDLFQDAITYILKDNMKIVRDFKGQCMFSTYLYLICRRYAIKKTRKEGLRLPGEGASHLIEGLPAPLIDETEVWDEDQKMALGEAIEKLDENSQIFIRMMFFDSRSTAEIMDFFGWNSPNSVYGKKNKIITKLRKIIGKILKNQGSS